MNNEKKPDTRKGNADHVSSQFHELNEEALDQFTGGNYTRVEYPGTVPVIKNKTTLEFDINLRDQSGTPLVSEFNTPITFGIDISDFDPPDKFVPVYIKDDGAETDIRGMLDR